MSTKKLLLYPLFLSIIIAIIVDKTKADTEIEKNRKTRNSITSV